MKVHGLTQVGWTLLLLLNMLPEHRLDQGMTVFVLILACLATFVGIGISSCDDHIENQERGNAGEV
jgi:hypothetical protein